MITRTKQNNQVALSEALLPKKSVDVDFETLAPHVLTDKQAKDTIAKRVRITVATLLVLAAIVGSLGAYGVYITTAQANAINTKYDLVSEANKDLLLQSTTGELALRSYYLSGNESFITSFKTARIKMIESSQNLLLRAKNIKDPGLEQLSIDYTGLVGIWLTTFADKSHVFSGVNNPRINQLTGIELVEGIRANSETISKFLNEASATSIKDAVRVRNLTIIVLSIVISLALITAVLLLVHQQADIAYPLVNLRKVINSIYQGEFGKRADEAIGPVEVRTVAHAINALADQREQVVDQTERLRLAKSHFIGTVNHELRTPLTSIAGYTELLADENIVLESRERVHLAAVIGRNAARLSDLIDNMLTVLRIDSNQVRFKLATFDARDAVRQAVIALEQVSLSQNIEVDFDSAVDPEISAVFKETLKTLLTNWEKLDRSKNV